VYSNCSSRPETIPPESFSGLPPPAGARIDAWIQYSQLDDTLDALISRPLLRELTRQPAKPNAKEGPDSMETTWAINPALDMLRAGHAQFNLFKICFGNLKLTDA